ncbi:MAG: gliding motility-associated C-terminal domain-containing protein [Bacteroidetes bacterium]|nr:gliding motility-associated C-terminal domain-containing protein [Bacteroidota bacterium]
MGKKRFILFLFCCFAVLVFKAQTLYWVGGSGNFNDQNHWSLTSGGLPTNIVPSSNTDVVFDDKSSTTAKCIVNFVGNNNCRSFEVISNSNKIVLTGTAFTDLTVSGDFILNRNVENYANTSLILSSETNNINQFKPLFTKLKGNVYFKKGSWNLFSFEIEKPNSLSFEAGTIYLNKSQIKAFDIEAKKNTVNIHSNSSILISENKLLLTKAQNFSNDLKVIAKIADSSLVKLNDPQNKIIQQSIANMVCTISYSFTNPSCFGGNDATISVTVDPTCAPGPFTLNFSTFATCISVVLGSNSVTLAGPTVFTIGGLTGCGGNAVDISLDQGFVTLASITNTTLPQNPTPINLAILASTSPSCAGQCNGSQVIKITGGTGPYTVNVNPIIPGPTFTIAAATNTLISNLCGGLQTYSITDSKGCTVVPTPSLAMTPSISLALVTKSVSCNLLCDGAFSITPTGGTPGYTVNFSTATNSVVGSGVTAATSGLCIGPVTATVTDTKGCTATASTNITQPPALTVTPTQTNISCGGLCNGTASVTVTGGTAPYSYTWAPGPNTATNSITNLCVGTQTVTIKDFNNCVVVPSPQFTITSPPPITVTPTFTNVSCNPGCNAIINAVASGPPGPFTFTLTSATITLTSLPPWINLCAGSYTIIAKAPSLCTGTVLVTITQPPALSVTATSQSITCFGLCNGAATVTPSGGNGGPFNFTWTPAPPVGQGTGVISNVCNATAFTISVTDVSLCPISTTVSITQPASVTPNITTGSLSCNAVCNGSINAIPVGPPGPYTYTLASSTATVFTAPPYINLCANIYSLTIGSAGGCVQMFTINIQQPNPLIPSISTTSINCFNQCNGTLAGSIAGGTPLYNFVWTTPTGTVAGGALAGQCAGNYVLTVTDANGCTASATATLTQPPDITVTINATNPTCFGSCNGNLIGVVAGGTPGYTLTWSNGPIGNPNSGLCAGNYTLVVNDTKGCIKSATATITTPSSITITQTTAPTSCAGSCNGSATVVALGGTPPYVYQFNTLPIPTTNTTGIIGGLCAGNYIANITDANGCSQSINFTITSPIALSAAITGIKSSCNACTGASTVTPSNGTPGYSFVWTNTLAVSVGTNAAVGALCPGNYTATVTDSKGCTATATVNIAQTVSVTVATSGSTIQCFGGLTATATANPLGGLAPYSYTWNPTLPTQTTQVATGLGAGTYTVLVADFNGCSNTATISFVNPPAIVIAPTQTNVNCFGNCTGAINSNASGGTGALTYSWSPGAITTANLSGLCVGTYTLKVTDANGCIKTPPAFTITSQPAIAATFTTTNPSACNVNNGSICATPSGGNGGPYTFAWTPPGGIGAATSCYSGLGAGSYSLVVSAGACSATLSAILTNPTGPTLNINTQSVTCFGGNNGAATVTAVGAGPFTFTWTPVVGFTTIGNVSTASSLFTGTYNISVTNVSTGCITTQTIAITQPATSITVNSAVTNAKCFAACNGSITVAVSGGTPTYTLNWLSGPITGQGTQTVTNLCLGTYTLNVNDANLCPRQVIFNITQPTALTLTTTASNVLCNAACNGSINATGGGGTGAITYTWLPVATFTGSTNQNIFNLCPASYTVNASDINGCPATTVVTITQPTALNSTLTIVNASCSNSCNATASLTAGGGVPTYSFSWSNGPATTPNIGNLCAGNYTGTIVDANGCTTAQGFTITAPSLFNVTLTPTNPLCNAICNGSISTVLAGAQGTVNFNWVATGAGQNPTNLCAGNYTLTATDASGCIATGVANLINPPALLANVTTTNPSCSGNCNGIAISTPANAVPPLSFTWTPAGPNSPTLSALCAGNYTVLVKDNNNCTDVQTFTLTNPPVLNINTSISPATCGSSNGSITVIAVGGTPNYTFQFTTPAVTNTTGVITGLFAGIYTVVVNDANNCTNTLTIPLSNSNGPSSAPITSSNISCNGQCTGTASVPTASIVGGAFPFSVSWIVPPSTSSVNPQINLCAGTYTAQIMDANNCLLFNSVTITQPASISILPNLTFPTCNGICNGSITLSTFGGTGPFQYTWSPGVSATATLINACAATYTVNILDNNLCPSTQTLTLPGVQNMTATPATTNNICFGSCIGAASVIAVSGSPNLPISFAWSNAQTGPFANNLCSGIYTLTATDAIGCFNTFTTNITAPLQITATSAVVSPSCNMCNGSGTVTALGGIAPYTYSWTSGAAASTASNLCAGLYQVLVTDNNLCTQLQNILISNSNGITGQTTNIQNELCSAPCTGAATVTAIGGTAPIQYNWINPVVSNSVITNLCAGIYFVQMMDAQGCIRTSSVTISPAPHLTLTPTINAPACTSPNGTITLVPTGGVGPYSISWVPGPNLSFTYANVPAGNYTVTVTDNGTPGNCQVTQVYAINNPNGPSITFTQSNISCFNACTGSITTLGTSTSTPVNYIWSNGANTAAVSGLCKGVITLTVGAFNGCLTVQSFTLTDNPALQLSLANVQQPKCHDDCNGAITLVPSGGSLPYSFSWSPLAAGNPQFSLCPGPSTAAIVYFATVTDSKGCATSTSLTLNNPAFITLTPTVTNSSCSSVKDGLLNMGVNGGTPSYSYTWMGPGAFTATTQNISNLLAGTYSLTLVDKSGCQRDTTLDVVPTVSVVAQAGNDFSLCPTPLVALTGTNSFGAVSYDWYLLPNNTNTVGNTANLLTPIPNITPGTYTFELVTTSSVAACRDTDQVVVYIYPLPVVDAGPTYTIPVFSNVTIGGNPTTSGSVTINWSPSFSLDDPSLQNPVASNTINTVYTVTVIDLVTGCTASDTMTVFLYPLIKIPNGFSPNGDNKNEKWIIDYLDQFPENTVEIYNRWGELLYFYNNYNGQFDGKFKGKDLPVGTYYYVINLNHPAYKTPFTGPLTIFR